MRPAGRRNGPNKMFARLDQNPISYRGKWGGDGLRRKYFSMKLISPFPPNQPECLILPSREISRGPHVKRFIMGIGKRQVKVRLTCLSTDVLGMHLPTPPLNKYKRSYFQLEMRFNTNEGAAITLWARGESMVQ